MKLTTNSRTTSVNAANSSELTRSNTIELSNSNYYGLVALIADMFDMIAKGSDMYMTLGATKDRSAFVLTVKLDGQPTPVYGTSLVEVSLKAGELL